MSGLSWLGIVRLGLVQTALGAVVVLTNSTLNRVMVNELMLPAVLPGALVAFHYAIQMLRPRWGHGSDQGGRRTPWILGGVGVLGLGGIGAAAGVALMATAPAAGLALLIAAYALIGGGVGAAGTALLALLATLVGPERRGAAGAIVWLMMIAGIAVCAATMGQVLDPYSPGRLVAVAAGVIAVAWVLALIGVLGIEGAPRAAERAEPMRFGAALAEVWGDPQGRRFTLFVFVAMLGFNLQDLILEPFAGHVFGYSVGQSTALSGTQHAGVFVGMLAMGGLSTGLGLGSLRVWMIGGCLASACGISLVALAGFGAVPLQAAVFTLGVANGSFAAAAIAAMMALATAGGPARAGTRMGLWGAAQAIAFGLGGLTGTIAADLARATIAEPAAAYGVVFGGEAAVFLIAAWIATRVSQPAPRPWRAVPIAGE